jgi:hypothetical protein
VQSRRRATSDAATAATPSSATTHIAAIAPRKTTHAASELSDASSATSASAHSKAKATKSVRGRIQPKVPGARGRQETHAAARASPYRLHMAELPLPTPPLGDDVVALRSWRETDIAAQLKAFSAPLFERFSDWAPKTVV